MDALSKHRLMALLNLDLQYQLDNTAPVNLLMMLFAR